ncbi:MAG: selenium-dependent molybdenum cofactor biosynthesis protein YqeB [Thermodesulfobacteriota bacterium]
MLLRQLKVLIRGAGEMASGVAVRLARARFAVLLTETPAPLCVRRTVSFCEAVHHGRVRVEDVEAELVDEPEKIGEVQTQGRLAVLVDPDLNCLPLFKPDVLVDAILAKKNLGLSTGLAELTVALGPGFEAGSDADVVIETNRGHNLGRLIYQGQAEADTGVPGEIAGESLRRLLRSPAEGLLKANLDIGDPVYAGQMVAEVAGRPVTAQVSGVLRGLIRPGSEVRAGLKIGDVDPRGRREFCFSVSDKARAIGGAVLEAILRHFNR